MASRRQIQTHGGPVIRKINANRERNQARAQSHVQSAPEVRKALPVEKPEVRRDRPVEPQERVREDASHEIPPAQTPTHNEESVVHNPQYEGPSREAPSKELDFTDTAQVDSPQEEIPPYGNKRTKRIAGNGAAIP